MKKFFEWCGRLEEKTHIFYFGVAILDTICLPTIILAEIYYP